MPNVEQTVPGCEQSIFELQLIEVKATGATLIDPSGKQVIVLPPDVDFSYHETAEFQRHYLVKDLGIQARILLGLQGYTKPWESTRIVFEPGEYLPMHLPVVALCPDSTFFHKSLSECTFCQSSLRNRRGFVGPFRECWFCMDSPSTHHGACCPHNPLAQEWNGAPHLQQHRANMVDLIRTLPFFNLSQPF